MGKSGANECNENSLSNCRVQLVLSIKDGMILEKRKKHNISMNDFNDIKIAVAGTGYVGLSIATLLSQHHHVTAVDVIPEKVEKLNNKISPSQDDYIEKYLAEKKLNLTATLDGKSAYADADFVVIAAPSLAAK